MIYPKYSELMDLKNRVNRGGIKSRSRAVSQMFGGQTSLLKGRGLDFSEFREYASNDDVRSIDWRVTARTGRPHSKVFSEERERSVFIYVDLAARMRFGTRKTFKSVQAARAAAVIAWFASRSHDKVGAVVFGQVEGGIKVLKPRASRLPLWQLFKLLCANPELAESSMPVATALRMTKSMVPRGASLFIISDFADSSPEFEKALALIGESRDLTLIQITDPADSHIADIGEIQFVDPSGQHAKINTRNREGRMTYLRSWQENEDRLESAAHKARAKLIRISTEGEVTKALSQELRRVR